MRIKRRSQESLTFPWTVRRIEAIKAITPIGTYLEVGLGDGVNFKNVEVPRKIGVDPSPMDPTLDHDSRVYLCPSDEFFSEHADAAAESFDLIYLDGMHTAEQTYRDFINSLRFTQARTIWLIDDVIPSDYFSCLRDQGTAIEARMELGLADRSWHGDVFKVVWMIAAFHPEIDYVTIVDSGNAQLLAWRGKRSWQCPSFTLADIAGLEFMDVLRGEAIYRKRSEQEAMRTLAEALEHQYR